MLVYILVIGNIFSNLFMIYILMYSSYITPNHIELDILPKMDKKVSTKRNIKTQLETQMLDIGETMKCLRNSLGDLKQSHSGEPIQDKALILKPSSLSHTKRPQTPSNSVLGNLDIQSSYFQ